jgi:hypothetical protein
MNELQKFITMDVCYDPYHTTVKWLWSESNANHCSNFNFYTCSDANYHHIAYACIRKFGGRKRFACLD